MDFVVATDGSTQSEAAIEHAVALAEATDGSVTVVHAVTPAVRTQGGSDPVVDPSNAADRLLMEDESDAGARGERILENASTVAEDGGMTVETELLHGDAVDAIVEYATAVDADGVVVGHRVLTERAEEHLGSVAKSLVSRSPVPVTVVS
jgi:nucleotide-binding universal stress UspA family protein